MKQKKRIRSMTASALAAAMLFGSCFPSFADVKPAVRYLDADGSLESCTDYTTVESSAVPVTWDEGWYVVDGAVSLEDGVICNGEVHLILKDGSHLETSTPNQGSGGRAGIAVTDSSSLTVYGQSDDEAAMGKITANGGYSSGGGQGGAGIGGNYGSSNGSITINGGYIEAYGAVSAPGIGSGDACSEGAKDITINGGIVKATGNGNGAGIGGGWCGTANNIQINGGKVIASSGNVNGSVGIGNGGQGRTATNIKADESVEIKAGDTENPTTLIAHTSDTDLAGIAEFNKPYVIADCLFILKGVTKRYDGKPAEWIVQEKTAGTEFEFEVSTDGGETWSDKTDEKPVFIEAGSYKVRVTASIPGVGESVKTADIIIDDRVYVTFMLDGVKYDEKLVASASTVEKPEDPEKEEHTFAGWFRDRACTVLWKFDGEKNADQVTADTTLYGKFYPYAVVSFDMNGHGEQVSPVKTASGSTAEKPDDPEDDGYWKFDGWFRDDSCTDPWDWDSDIVDGDITLFARWEDTFVDDDDTVPAKPFRTGTWNDPVTDGTWSQDSSGAWYYKTNAFFRNTWGCIQYTDRNGAVQTGWFRFDANGKMLTGWQLINGSWFYLAETNDGVRGMMQQGWIDWNGGQYYLAETRDGNGGRMLAGTTTPDGHAVDADGKRIQ